MKIMKIMITCISMTYHDEIEHREGLIRYLDYCKTHHIYHDYLMESCECELPDIFEYEEDPYTYEPEIR